MRPDTYYRVQFVDGFGIKVRVPANVTSPTFAIEHNVPFFAWPTGDGERFVINPRNVLYVQEVPEKEPF